MGKILSLLKSLLDSESLRSNPNSGVVAPLDAFTRLRGINPPLLIDLRVAEEYMESHIPRAERMSIPEVRALLNRTDKSKPLLFYCKDEYLSEVALRMARKSGFTYSAYIAGGFDAWSRRSLPVEPKK